MKPIPVIFQGGSYGTYLLWVLTMLSTDADIFDPHEHDGNSHKFTDFYNLDIRKWLNAPKPVPTNSFFKVHGKIEENHSFLNNVNLLTDYFGKSILLYPSENSYLLHSNNYTYKISKDVWSGPFSHVKYNDLYHSFQINKNTKFENIPNWVIREWLSYNFFNSMNSQLEWFLPDNIKTDNCLIIFIEDILYDINATIFKIQNFLDIKFINSINKIKTIHEINVSRQSYANQDELAKNIINSVVTNVNYSWNPGELTIVTEAWIQQELRSLGHNFKCYNLNNFPTSTAEISKLI